MTSEDFDESLSSPLVISPSPRGGSVKVERARVLRVSPGHGTMPESRFWTHFSGSTRALLLKEEVVEMGQCACILPHGSYRRESRVSRSGRLIS